MYDFRKLSPEQREDVLAWRKANQLPWHSPPHREMGYSGRYLVSAACYEHQAYIGISPERMTSCEQELLSVCQETESEVYAWSLLPNHYHRLIRSPSIEAVCQRLGKFHGRSSRRWNREEGRNGRKVWYRCFDREMRSERHLRASRD